MTHADTAANLVLGNRNTDYGSPHADFSGVALIWSGILNTKLKERITAEEVALMMVGLKLKREAHRHKDDNIVDAHGYLLCLEWITSGAMPEPQAHIHEQTIESICTSEGMTCETCHQKKPCLCDK